MKKCITLYLDQKGNKHSAYYSNVGRLGHKVALRHYLKSMESVISSNFQKSTINDVIENHRILSGLKTSTKGGGPTRSKNSVSNFNEKKIAQEVIIRDKSKELMEAEEGMTITTINQLGSEERKALYETYYEQAANHYQSSQELKDELLSERNELLDIWKIERKEKSDYHDMIQRFIEHRLSVIELGGDLTEVMNTFGEVEGTLSEIQTSIVDNINTFMKSTIVDDPNAVIIPELTIDVDGWDNRSRIDLFVYYPKSNRTVIYDFKFYGEKSFQDYDTSSRGHLTGSAQSLKNNNRDLNIIQMSEYRYMLEQLGLTNVQSKIVPFVLNSKKDSTSKVKVVESVTAKKHINARYAKDVIENILSKEKGIDLKLKESPTNVAGKVHSVGSLLNNMLSNSTNRGSIAEQDKGTIYDIPVKTENGVFKFFNTISNEWAILEGDTKQERNINLANYLKIKKAYTSSVAAETINFLHGDMKNWDPSSNLGREIKKTKSFKQAAIEARDTEQGGAEVYSHNVMDRMEKEASKILSKDTNIEAALRQLFQEFDSNYYDFDDISTDNRFGDTDQIIIKVTHKSSGVVTLRGISPGSLGTMGFDTGDGKKRTTVLGNYLTDIQARAYMIRRKDKQFDMELLGMGAIMKQMRRDDPTIQFTPPKVGVLRSGNISSRSINMVELDHILGVLGSVVDPNDITTEYQEILKTKLTNDNRMRDHYADEAMEALRTSDFFTKNTYVIKSTRSTLAHIESMKMNSGANYSLLMESLTELKRSMDQAFQSREYAGHPADYDWYVKISNLILVLEGLDPYVNIADSELKQKSERKIMTIGNSHHQYLTTLGSVYKAAQLDVFSGFMTRKEAWDVLIKKYMKSEGLSSESFNKSKKRELFKKLFKSYDEANPASIAENLMILKDSSQAHSKEAAALIDYLNDMQVKMMEMKLGKEKYDKWIQSDSYIKGAMPVQDKSQASQDEENPGTPMELAQKFKRSIFGKKAAAKELDDSRFTYHITNQFAEQQLVNKKRLKRAGYNELGDLVHNQPLDLEYNLDVLFESMVLDTLTQKHYERALVLKSAVDIALMTQDNTGQAKTENIQKMVQGFTDLIIHRSINDPFDETSDNWAIRGSSALSKVALALSPSYLIMETFTNTFNLTAEITNQFITSKLIKNAETYFGAGDMLKAMKLMGTDYELTNKLAMRYGMVVRDPAKLKEARYRNSQSTIFNSKSFYWINALSIETSQTMVLIAKMIHDGSLAAHSLDSNGQLVYDETKDKRFFKQAGEKLTDTEIKERKLKHEFYLEELAKEEGISEDGKLSKAYSNIDVTTMHTITTERFASLSADQKVLVETIPLGIAFMRFKNWLIAKKEVWWREYNPESKLKQNLRLIKDENHPDGQYYTYIGEPSEGILNSFIATARGLRIKGFNDDIIPENLALLRKKNMIRGINDLLLAALLAMIMKAIFNKGIEMVKGKDGTFTEKEIPNSKVMQTLERITGNSIADLTFVLPMWNVVSGDQSAIPIVGAMSNMTKGLFGMMTEAFQGDVDGMLNNLNKVVRTSGAIRGLEDFGYEGYKSLNED